MCLKNFHSLLLRLSYLPFKRSFHLTNIYRTKNLNENIKLNTNFRTLIPLSEFKERQTNLVNLIEKYLIENGSSKLQSLIIVSSAKKLYEADTYIPYVTFKQNSEFTYLTGLNVKDASECILIIRSNSSKFKAHLFSPLMSDAQRVWDGPGLLSLQNEKHLSAIFDSIHDINDLASFIQTHSNHNLFISKSGLKIPKPSKDSKEILIDETQLYTNRPPVDLSQFIDKLRVIKSSNEMHCMRRSCTTSAHSMERAIKWSQKQSLVNSDLFGIEGVNESQIAAKFEYESKILGARKLAFPTVCAGNGRSTIIHYGNNNEFVKPSQWLLMDAGCEDLDGYNSDLTRCWPIPGKKDSRFRLTEALYQALCEVQSDIITKLNETIENSSLNNLFQMMCHFLAKVFIEFGLSPNSVKEATHLVERFCPHHVSHYLGLDVHDTPYIGRDVPLKPGMCFTIEPGLYFRPEDSKVKEEFKNIGLRIENDFLINENWQLENLTRKAPLHSST